MFKIFLLTSSDLIIYILRDSYSMRYKKPLNIDYILYFFCYCYLFPHVHTRVRYYTRGVTIERSV